MSSEGKEGGPSNSKSPGKGGKSLQLMQQRLQSQQATATTQNPPAQAPAPTAPSASPPSASPPVVSTSPSAGRPKGKDFAAMSARAPLRTAPQIAPPPSASPPAGSQQSAPVMMQGGPGKPKGKDFSAMASRMGAPPPAVQITPAQQSAQAARAAQMQAAARAAAGLPPLERPTATSVTTIPPNILPPKISNPHQRSGSIGINSQQQQQQQQSAPASSSFSSEQQARSMGAASLQAKTNAPPPIPAQAPRPRSTSAGQRRTLHSKTSSGGIATSPIPPPKPREPSTIPTPTPTAMESRVAGLTSTAVAAPHMAPLVGPRIQDLLQQLDPAYTLDAAAEHQILQLTDDFLDKVCKQGLRLAQHRNSKTLDVQDLQMVLAKQWNIIIPGLGPPVAKKPKVVRSPSIGSNSGAKRKPEAAPLGGHGRKMVKANAGSAVAGGEGNAM